MSERDDAAVPTPTLKFADEHVEDILAGRKTVTLRVGDVQLTIGDRFQLVDADGDRFASAIVDDRGYTTIREAAQIDWSGHRNYQDSEALLEELRGYYPDEDLGESDCVEIVRWKWEDLWQ